MRTALLYLFLATYSLEATSDWLFVTNNSSGTKYYIDSSRIKRVGKSHVRGWTLSDFSNSISPKQDFLSSIQLSEFDCDLTAERIITSAYYSGHMGNGTLLESSNASLGWQVALPDSVRETIASQLCALK